LGNVIPQWHINRKPRPPRTDFKNVWDHTQNEDKTIKQPFILDMVLGDSPHIFCGFAMVKRTEWNVLTLKPHWIKAPPHSFAFRKRPSVSGRVTEKSFAACENDASGL